MQQYSKINVRQKTDLHKKGSSSAYLIIGKTSIASSNKTNLLSRN